MLTSITYAKGIGSIDLSAIDANALSPAVNETFRFIDGRAFSGLGVASAGELRVTLANGIWTVEGDTDGNGAADLFIRVVDPAVPIVQGSFIP